MKKLPKVFTIVLNYNGIDCLIRCLDSIYASDYVNMEVIVVDNCSTDGSFEIARKKFSKFHFIKNSHNIGFAAGNNVAIRFALEKMADYVFLLNNDAFVDKDSIRNLVSACDELPNVGLASPIIYKDLKENIWFSGGKILWKKMKTIHENSVLSSSPYLTEYATGCSLLIKKDVFAKIGLFDEKFFLYYEDADFSWRARLNDFNIFIVPSSIVYHEEKSNKSNSLKLYWLIFSSILFFRKNSTGLNRLWINFYLLIRRFRFKIKLFFDSKNEKFLQIIKAFQDSKSN